MSEYAELLATIAQVAIAFAGFAGVVAAFSTFRLAPEATAYRIRMLVAVALLVLVSSLAPPVVAAFGISGHAALRICALLLAVGAISVATGMWSPLRRLYREGLLQTQAITAVWYTITGAMIVALLIVAAGGLVGLAPALYLTGLFFGIVLCCFYFIATLFAIELGKR